MNNKDKEYEKIMKERSDSFLAYVAKASEEEMLEEFGRWECELGDEEVPKDLESNILKMAREFTAKETLKRNKLNARKYLKVAALVIIIVTTSFTVLAVNVDAFRIRIFDFLFESNEDFTRIEPVEQNTSTGEIKKALPVEWSDYFCPSYLPEGYLLAETESIANIKTIYYQDSSQNVLSLTQGPADSADIYVDNDDVEKGEVSINGTQAYWTLKHGQLNLIWNHNSYRLMLYAPVELEEMVKIAKNLKFVN